MNGHPDTFVCTCNLDRTLSGGSKIHGSRPSLHCCNSDCSKHIRIILGLVAEVLRTIFADRYLDALLGKAFAERGALNDTGEFLGRVDGKRRREVCRENGEFLAHDGGDAASGADVAHTDLESKRSPRFARTGLAE